jgi:hypothetical protein
MKKIQAFAIAAILLCCFTFPPADVKLQYVFKKGETYELAQVSNQTIKQTLPGAGEMTTEVVTSGLLTFKIVELTSTGARIEAQYTKLKIDTKGPMAMSMDTESASEEMPNKVLKSMMNKPFFFVMTNLGVVEKTENVENIYSGLSTIGMDENTLAMTKQTFQQTINEANLKALLETALISYPQNKIKTGDSWTTTSGVAINFPMQSENTWNLKMVEGDVASVDSDGILKNSGTDNNMSLPNGIKAKTDLSGRQASKSKINLKNGWPTETKVLSEIKGKITLLAGTMLPSDMEVPMEIVSESTFTIIKK